TGQRQNVDETVKQLQPNADGSYCVVTRATREFAVLDYSHVLPVATKDKILDKLEWAWDLNYFTLNVDTRRNIQLQIVCPEIHRHFDETKKSNHDGWFWLPDWDDVATLMKMYDCYVGCTMDGPAPAQYPNVRRNPDTFYEGRTSFKYRLIPFPAMKSAWAVRQLGDTTSPFTKDSPVTQYYYPFTEMPPVYLHIPYHFIICDTGRKVNGIYGSNYEDSTQIAQDLPHLTPLRRIVLAACRGIYNAWMNAMPDSAW
ncbi:hypothetical protein C8Q74DRAFT_1177319, partial [Fomes fomentarius]